MFTWLLGVISGALLPVQTSINTKFSEWAHSSLRGVMVSFFGGLAVSIAAMIISGDSFYVSPEYFTTEPFWMWLGGLFGILLISINIIILPKIGSAETVIFAVFGQIFGGMVIDNFGFFRQGVIAVTPLRVLGTVLVFVGVVLTSVSDGRKSRAAQAAPAEALTEGGVADGKLPSAEQSNTKPLSSKTSGKNFYRLLGVIGGCCGAMQAAVNGYLGTVVNSTPKTSLISFTGGILLMVIILAAMRIVKGRIEHEPWSENRWWMWCGGIPGAGIVFSNVILVNVYGTGLAMIFALLGQLLGGVLVDSFGFLGIEKNVPDKIKIIGILLVIGSAFLTNA